jgi:putative MATE family efflux protein
MSLDLFETEPPLKLLGRFAWPAIVSLMANALYNVVDRAFVGQLVGTEALTAVSVVFPLMIAVFAVALGIGSGTATLVSLALGRKDTNEAEAALTQTLGLSLAASLVVAGVLVWGTEPLLRLLATPESVVKPATEFFLVTLGGLPFLTVSIGVGNAIRSQGRAKTAMFTGLLGIVLNTILCALFVGLWGWGLMGSAWATVLAQAAGAVVTVGFYFTRLSSLRFRWKHVPPQGELLRRIVVLGLPSFLLEAIFVVVMFVLNARVQEFGAEKALASVGIINTISGLFFMPAIGLVQGAVPLFGYYQGAGKADLNRQVFLWVLVICTVFFTACTVVIEVFPEVLVGIFTRDPVLIGFCLDPLRVFLAVTPLAALFVLPASYFQAIGRPVPALVISLVRPAALVALVIVVPHFWGFWGFLSTGPISDGLGVLVALGYLAADTSLRRKVPSVDSEGQRKP